MPGVDVAVGEEPVDRFAEADAEAARRREALAARQEAARVPPLARPQPVSAAGAPPSPDSAVAAAREAARSAASLDELRAIVESFDGCALKATASRTVFEDGARDARVMFVGEAPGREEDMEGRPFVGKSGQLLDRMLASVGLDRQDQRLYRQHHSLAAAGQPDADAAGDRHLRALRAPADRTEGAGAAGLRRCALDRDAARAEGHHEVRGRLMGFEAGGRTIQAIATLHPAYLLRSPIAKRLAWRDMLTIRKTLGMLGTIAGPRGSFTSPPRGEVGRRPGEGASSHPERSTPPHPPRSRSATSPRRGEVKRVRARLSREKVGIGWAMALSRQNRTSGQAGAAACLRFRFNGRGKVSMLQSLGRLSCDADSGGGETDSGSSRDDSGRARPPGRL
jgi:uracil-DNA glycosylase